MPQRRHAHAVATLVVALAWSSAVPPMAHGQSAAMGKLRVDPSVMSSRCVTKVSPLYPQIPPADGPVSVKLEILVTRQGAVQPVDVLSGPADFQDAARSAVRLWRYLPFLRGGEPVDVITEAIVVFVPGAPGGMITHPQH